MYTPEQHIQLLQQQRLLQHRQYQQQQQQLYKIAPLVPFPLQVVYMPQARMTGRVKFFNIVKGYGFIVPTKEDNTRCKTEEDVFVHHTSIVSTNKQFLATLKKGEKVEYELHDGPKGIHALYVTGPGGRPINNGLLDCYYHNQPTSPPQIPTNELSLLSSPKPMNGEASHYYRSKPGGSVGYPPSLYYQQHLVAYILPQQHHCLQRE